MAACPGNIKRTEYGQLHIFRTGPLGQHFTCKLTVDSVNYQSSLQYMYHQKALLFQDNEIAAKVMKCTDQHYDKFFEKVKNREKLNLWESRCADIIHKGNQEKFDQNVGLRQSLLETAGKLLVYADAKDCLLGIGIDDRNDGKAYDKKQWRGKNELGNVLTNIRDDILSAYQWCENDKCMARWSKDKKFYDATIVWIHPQRTTCKVQFDKYKDCEECDPICLIPRKDHRQFASHGKQGRRPTDEDWDKEVDLAERSSDGSEQRKKFTFFWQGYDKLSQWYGCKFKVDGIAYNCAEQFMMHQKALHFKDNKTAEEILKTKLPKHQKDLGRTVRGYDEASWDSVCEDIVIRGNMAKFSQNSDLRTHLLSTAGKILAEASPYDCKWGIGLTADDPRAADERKWRGTNLLGKCLMVVREELMKKGADFHDDAVHEDCESDPEEGYTMFWHQPSPFSQWHPASFHIGGITYNCAEQYMMHQKAVYFGDSECAFRILMETEPRRQKQLAGGVRRFNETKWNAVSQQFVKEGSIGKYSQNPHLRRELFATANTELVEASADDFRWGIGWTKDDRLSWTRRTWRGENWLGLILTEVRDELIKKTWPESDEDYREPRYGEAQSWRAFSKPGSPFHLFHPAEIDYDGNKYKSAGHCLLNKLSKSAGNESIAKLVTELNKPEQLMNLLSELMKGLDQWSDDLNNVLESVNKAKFQQHQNLREKLLDTYTDMLVYAGGERHLGIDYSLGVRGYTERENKLGQVLMKLRNEYLPPQTPASQRASKRPRDSSGDWRSKDASDRSFNERHNSKTPRRDDNVWGSSSRRDISNKRGTGSSHSSRDDRSSRIQRGSRDDGRSSRNSSSERYDINELYADSTDRKNICETPKSSTIADRSHSDNSFKDERIEMSSSSLSRQHRDFDDSCSRKEEADEMKSGKKDKRHSALNAMQQCIDVFFSDNTNPFHLWYPAPVQVAGKQYTCVGQLLLHKAATEVLKDNQLARRIIDNGGDENLQQEVKEACDKENGHGWQDLITGCLPELHQLKFSQHRDLAEILLKTGNTNLLYVAPDNRLGTGGMNAYGKFSGRNFLGKTLVKFRSTFDPSAHCDELGSPEVAAAATASSCPESATSPSATSCSGLTRADAEGVGHKKPKKEKKKKRHRRDDDDDRPKKKSRRNKSSDE